MEHIASQEPMIRKAIDIEEAFKKSDQDRYLYELREKGRRDYQSALNYAEVKGKAEGKAEGFEEAKISIACSMLENGMQYDDVAKSTGLSIDELKKLKVT